jgi:aminopeptidase N
VTTAQIIAFFNKRSGKNLTHIFDQYLHQADLPEFEYKIVDRKDGNLTMSYRWANTAKKFDLPIKITVTKGTYETVVPARSWQLIDLNYFDPKDFKIQTDRFLLKDKED